jgi:hypothetical protein
LVAHNKMKVQMSHFVESYLDIFKHCRTVTTGSTGKTLEDKLGLKVYHKVASGPLGGDQEIGGMVTQGKTTVISSPWCALIRELSSPFLFCRPCPRHLFSGLPPVAQLPVAQVWPKSFSWAKLGPQVAWAKLGPQVELSTVVWAKLGPQVELNILGPQEHHSYAYKSLQLLTCSGY